MAQLNEPDRTIELIRRLREDPTFFEHAVRVLSQTMAAPDGPMPWEIVSDLQAPGGLGEQLLPGGAPVPGGFLPQLRGLDYGGSIGEGLVPPPAAPLPNSATREPTNVNPVSGGVAPTYTGGTSLQELTGQTPEGLSAMHQFLLAAAGALNPYPDVNPGMVPFSRGPRAAPFVPPPVPQALIRDVAPGGPLPPPVDGPVPALGSPVAQSPTPAATPLPVPPAPTPRPTVAAQGSAGTVTPPTPQAKPSAQAGSQATPESEGARRKAAETRERTKKKDEGNMDDLLLALAQLGAAAGGGAPHPGSPSPGRGGEGASGTLFPAIAPGGGVAYPGLLNYLQQLHRFG